MLNDEEINETWNSAKIIQSLLMIAAISSVTYMGGQIQNLTRAMADVEHRLTRIETNSAGLISRRLDDIDRTTKDHENRIRVIESSKSWIKEIKPKE